MLGEVTDSLLGDNDVWLESHNMLTHSSNLSLLHSEGFLEIVFLGELHVGHGLSLLVFQWAIEEDDSWVLDVSSHGWMSDVLVEHHTIEDHAVFEDTTWNLLNLGVSLDINLNVVVGVLVVDASDGFDGEVDNQGSPLGGELGADCGVNDLGEIFVALEVDWFLK